jgi:hypothetical protein
MNDSGVTWQVNLRQHDFFFITILADCYHILGQCLPDGSGIMSMGCLTFRKGVQTNCQSPGDSVGLSQRATTQEASSHYFRCHEEYTSYAFTVIHSVYRQTTLRCTDHDVITVDEFHAWYTFGFVVMRNTMLVWHYWNDLLGTFLIAHYKRMEFVPLLLVYQLSILLNINIDEINSKAKHS